MKRFPRAEISLSALKHNLLTLKKCAPKSQIMAVVKANAYGHGLLNVATGLDGLVDGFGLARLEEALTLRCGGIKAKLLLLEGFFREQDLGVLVQHHIDTVVHHASQIDMLENAQLASPVKVWLKIDSGMHRLGFTPQEFNDVYQRLLACPAVAKPINLISHFSCADEPDNDYTNRQMMQFDSLVTGLPGESALANSAAVLFWPQSHRDWIRPGIALYGVSPVMGDCGRNHDLIPAMSLKSQLIAVRSHQANQPVGYGAHWVAKQDTTLGVVAIGYGDGYPRNAPIGTPVWINNRCVNVVGRVSMDMLTVDLGANATDKVGDDVLLWGKELPIEEVAEHIGTIAYELMTKLTPRVAVCFD